MIFNLRYFLALTATAIVLCACATSPEIPLTLGQKLEARDYSVGEEVKRINNYNLNGWNYLDNKHFIIKVGASQHYLVTLRNSCNELSSATNIAFKTTIGMLSAHDQLLVKGPTRFIEHCFIQSLNKLEKKVNNAIAS